MISFEITLADPPKPTVRRGRSRGLEQPAREPLVATFAARLGPNFKDGYLTVAIPQEHVKALGFSSSVEEYDWPFPETRRIHVKTYITALEAQQPVTVKLYDGKAEDSDYDDGELRGV